MAKLVLLNSRAYANAVDLSGVANKAEISGEYEVKDVTTFGSAGNKEVLAGLGSAKVAMEGFWEAGDAMKVDNDAWANLGGAGPWTFCPVGVATSDVAYFVRAVETGYDLGGQVGDVAPFKAEAQSSWPLVRGQVALVPGTARTASGVGVSLQLGAVPAGKSLYAALHVISVSGTTPSATFRIESDNATGFPSAATVITFNAATAVGGQIARVVGPTTDDWFRAAWTISGTTPSFLAIVALGIA